MNESLIEQAANLAAAPIVPSEIGQSPGESRQRKLLKFAREVELFQNLDGEAFAAVPVGGYLDNVPLRDKRFSYFLNYEFLKREGIPAGTNAISDVIASLEAIAAHEGKKHPIHVRVGQAREKLYLDLADDARNVVEVSQDGWKVVSSAPVKFWRPRGMRPLPLPQRGGNLDMLRAFLNATEEDYKLIAAWVVAAMRNTGPYPVLVIHGEQGSAKSTTSRLLRTLIDPNQAALRTPPKSEEDLPIAARNGWVIALDNVSHLQDWLSDMLCRVATGGGFGKRERYSDTSEVLIQVQRPQLLNGIEEIACRSDLLDRSLIVDLPSIPEDRRKSEEQFWRDFEQAHPKILGALLDVLVVALRNYGALKVERASRMADFERWILAAEPALLSEKWKEGDFRRAYANSRRNANTISMEAVPWIGSIQELLRHHRGNWKGTATDLLTAINSRAEAERFAANWPKTGRSLANALRRLRPNLRVLNIHVEFRRDKNRLIHIRAAGMASGEDNKGGSLF
jgi:hypothetical protein